MKVLLLSCMFASTNLITHESLYSSSKLLNEYLLYDKLWGPSQRVVTLFFLFIFIAIAIKRITAQIAIEIVDARNIIAGYCIRIIWWCLYFDNVTATI